jgi:hypothetical protein
MLETINLLVGLAVVMLLVSFAVTLITQIIANLLNLRGWALRMKVTNLLVLIDDGIEPRDAAQIAGLILRNALVGQPGLPWRGQTRKAPADGKAAPPPLIELGLRPAAVIHREELTRLLLSFGKDPGEYPDTWRWFGHAPLDTKELQRKMRVSLKGNEVDDPEAFLTHIQKWCLKLERTHPEMSNSQRANEAILNFKTSKFIGKLYGWFDQTADRATDLFTMWTHIVTIAVSLVVAATLQLDTLSLINRLSTDRAVRTQLVNWAEQHVDTTGGGDTLKPKVTVAAQAALAPDNLIAVPDSLDAWAQSWSIVTPCPSKSPPAAVCRQPHMSLIVGVLLSAILLSLGGPFWYEVLKNLLKLRSSLAGKEDDERKTRQTRQSPDGGASAANA